MVRGQKWRCTNPSCGAEIVVTESPRQTQPTQPACGCGSKMKRAYEKPVVKKLPLAER